MSIRPLSILIAALGGEGGGVLTNWIIAAVEAQGFPVQSTSIPGVAQRTGATTYYIEFVPVPSPELGDRIPVFALVPGVGDIDILVASELLEASRSVANGFVAADRTLVIASTHRTYAMTEKMAMADGRMDSKRLVGAIEQQAAGALLFDMDALARQSGAMINAVLLGAIAGSFRLPIPVEAFESAIRADGKAVETNLRGFRAGLEMARQQGQPRPEHVPNPLPAAGASTLPAAEREIVAGMPDAAHAFVIEGVRRLTQYQDSAYGRLYLERLASIREADSRASMAGKLLRETARHLALRMSFEDVIRVAQAKIDPARLARIAADKGVGPDQVMSVTEFLKPGIEEICSILPPWLARPILSLSARRGWLGRAYWGMRIDSTSIGGFLRLWLLAKLRPWRPRSHRFIEEQAAIEAWLGLIRDAAAVSGDLALEVAQCARLIKGYGDTHRRGVENFRQIESRVIRPALSGRLPPRLAADAVASARAAALTDPNGAALAACLAKIDGTEMRQAAQ